MRFLRKKHVVEMIGLSYVHILRLEKQRKFPKRVVLGPSAVGWVEAEVEEWMKARVTERGSPQEEETLRARVARATHARHKAGKTVAA